MAHTIDRLLKLSAREDAAIDLPAGSFQICRVCSFIAEISSSSS